MPVRWTAYVTGVDLLLFDALSAAAAAAADCATSALMRVSSRKVTSSSTFSSRPGMRDASTCGGPVGRVKCEVSARVSMEPGPARWLGDKMNGA